MRRTTKAISTVKQIEGCRSLEEAVLHLMDDLRATKNVYCQFHQLAPYHGFPVHKHLKTNEWTVVCDAEFDLVTRKDNVDNVQRVKCLSKATVIYVPIGTCHTIRGTETELRYAVIKDGPDDFNRC